MSVCKMWDFRPFPTDVSKFDAGFKYYGTLNNCTLVGNSAFQAGGGAGYSTLNNCIAYYNTAPSGANYYYATLNYSCTFPVPPSGTGNIVAEPGLVHREAGNLRLRYDSPCIDAGNNAYVAGSTDLDRNPRIVGCTVDIGTYEFQPRLLTPVVLKGTNECVTSVVLCWEAATNWTCFLEQSTNLPHFWPLTTNLAGQAATTCFADTNASCAPVRFYRVGVDCLRR